MLFTLLHLLRPKQRIPSVFFFFQPVSRDVYHYPCLRVYACGYVQTAKFAKARCDSQTLSEVLDHLWLLTIGLHGALQVLVRSMKWLETCDLSTVSDTFIIVDTNNYTECRLSRRIE
jgi:hypothetical protein